jgi:hypothetical protein
MAKMTVSQGLRAVADLKGKLKKNKEHAQASLTYFEKTPPAFKFGEEMEEAHKTRSEMLRLQTAIAVANATTEIDWQGKKILVAFAVRHLEELRDQLAWLDSIEPFLLDQKEVEEDNIENDWQNGQYVRVNRPKKKICALPLGERFKLRQKLQEEHNRLNDIVEASNHQTLLRLE